MNAAPVSATYREIAVTLGLGDEQYPCVVRLGDGSQPMTDTAALGWAGNPILRWNGWVAEPLFDRATVERLAADWAPEPEFDKISWDGDTVVVVRPVYTDDPGYEPERISPVVVAGIQRWCIGGCSMTWDEVRP